MQYILGKGENYRISLMWNSVNAHGEIVTTIFFVFLRLSGLHKAVYEKEFNEDMFKCISVSSHLLTMSLSESGAWRSYREQ